jgi:hypothetical protein
MDESLVKYLAEKKLIAYAVAMILSFILVWNAKIQDGNYETIAVASVLAYIAGEAYEKKNKV